MACRERHVDVVGRSGIGREAIEHAVTIDVAIEIVVVPEHVVLNIGRPVVHNHLPSGLRVIRALTPFEGASFLKRVRKS